MVHTLKLCPSLWTGCKMRQARRLQWPLDSTNICGCFLCRLWLEFLNSVVQLLGHVWLFATPWLAAQQASLFLTILWCFLKLMFFCSVIPLSPPSPPALNLSHHQGLFQWVSSLHQVAKVLELQLQHQYSNEYSGLSKWTSYSSCFSECWSSRFAMMWF